MPKLVKRYEENGTSKDIEVALDNLELEAEIKLIKQKLNEVILWLQQLQTTQEKK
jgi:hypothetical protein